MREAYHSRSAVSEIPDMNLRNFPCSALESLVELLGDPVPVKGIPELVDSAGQVDRLFFAQGEIDGLQLLDQRLPCLVPWMVGVFPVLGRLTRLPGYPLPDLNSTCPVHKDDEVLVCGLCDLLFDLSPGPVIRHPAVTVRIAPEDLHASLLRQPLEEICSAVHCHRELT